MKSMKRANRRAATRNAKKRHIRDNTGDSGFRRWVRRDDLTTRDGMTRHDRIAKDVFSAEMNGYIEEEKEVKEIEEMSIYDLTYMDDLLEDYEYMYNEQAMQWYNENIAA